ncbi:MAG: response regulator [Sphingosinicella sp.]|nr:response regulator [Sphingosinicella sp.]
MRLHLRGARPIGQKYWFARERASIEMADRAESLATRRIHLDLAALLRMKAENFHHVGKRLLRPLGKVVPLILRRPAKAPKPLVMICDDEELVVDLLEHHLCNAGYEVVRAADGAIALALLEHRIPAVIILAVMIPVISGTEVLKRIRETPDLRKIPVMMLTHRDSEQDVIDALRDGASDYLTKPFMIGEVLERVSKLITPYEHPLESLLEELAA